MESNTWLYLVISFPCMRKWQPSDSLPPASAKIAHLEGIWIPKHTVQKACSFYCAPSSWSFQAKQWYEVGRCGELQPNAPKRQVPKLYKRRGGSRPKVLPLLVRGEIYSHECDLGKTRSSRLVSTSRTFYEICLKSSLYVRCLSSSHASKWYQ